MYIEVTATTFYKLINFHHFLHYENLESAKKYFYYNKEINQKAMIIHNFTSSKTIVQFYLQDINA